MLPVSVLKELEICQENVYNEAILSKKTGWLYSFGKFLEKRL